MGGVFSSYAVVKSFGDLALVKTSILEKLQEYELEMASFLLSRTIPEDASLEQIMIIFQAAALDAPNTNTQPLWKILGMAAKNTAEFIEGVENSTTQFISEGIDSKYADNITDLIRDVLIIIPSIEDDERKTMSLIRAEGDLKMIVGGLWGKMAYGKWVPGFEDIFALWRVGVLTIFVAAYQHLERGDTTQELIDVYREDYHRDLTIIMRRYKEFRISKCRFSRSPIGFPDTDGGIRQGPTSCGYHFIDDFQRKRIDLGPHKSGTFKASTKKRYNDMFLEHIHAQFTFFQVSIVGL